MENGFKVLIVAWVHETDSYNHYVGYVVDERGKQHLVTPDNCTARKRVRAYRHSAWDNPREKAVRKIRAEAKRQGHGDRFLVVHVTGYHEQSQFTDQKGYSLEI